MPPGAAVAGAVVVPVYVDVVMVWTVPPGAVVAAVAAAAGVVPLDVAMVWPFWEVLKVAALRARVVADVVMARGRRGRYVESRKVAALQ